MATTWKFYADAAGVAEATGGATVVDGGSPTDRILYFGSIAAGKTLQAASAPGTDQITISPADASPGSGAETTALKLALSSAGLASATAGAAINIGATLNSGTGGFVVVYVRTTQGALAVGAHPGLSLTTNAVVEA